MYIVVINGSEIKQTFQRNENEKKSSWGNKSQAKIDMHNKNEQ